MLFVFQAFDAEDAVAKRQGNYPAHRAHLEDTARYNIKIVVSGPLVADDGETPVGIMFIVEAQDRATAENYFSNDPFAQNGIWDTTHLTAFKKLKG